ncbi:hypothetical protein B9Z55_016715 [Caenorhabditis nigoni]|uniref:Serpentine receptor class gamma n=1 Tax=Caenorhabditis nigoni TaxID=1611254 RepID=A0A2G5T6S5_9PELO|nr:hypothetical protein B9Z55_016715 [Caenorhabditis nigoni]
MTDVKIAFLGFLVFNSFIFNILGVFTPNWTSNRTYLELGAGLRLTLASSFMFGTLALSGITFALFLYVYYQVKSNDYSSSLRKWFRIINLSSIIAIILTVAAIIIIATSNSYNMVSTPQGGPEPVTLGYSAWLCFISVILTVAIASISEYIASEEC